MQGEINDLRAELDEAKLLARQGQALSKRVVVVCGGARGIGPEIASRLVKEGAKVVVVDANSASAKGKVCDFGREGEGGRGGGDVPNFPNISRLCFTKNTILYQLLVIVTLAMLRQSRVCSWVRRASWVTKMCTCR